MYQLIVAALLSSSWILAIGGHPFFRQDDALVKVGRSKPGVAGAFNYKNDYYRGESTPAKRTTASEPHLINDCIYMSSDEGDFYHKSSNVDGTACGAYIFAEPDQKIEIHFNYVDVSCKNGGLVSFVDGWELNGQFFPSPADHPAAMSSRFAEFCGQKSVKKVFLASQNVALIQYRMPATGGSFSFSVKFVKNPTPCNVLFQSIEDILTIKNYGKRVNCSISTLFPAVIEVAALSVGVVPLRGRSLELETGTLHKCQKRGLDDFLQVGGSSGLDNANLILADSLCGMDSKPSKRPEMIGCGTSTVRLVSSGAYDNSATVVVRQMTEEDIANGYMSVICPLE